MAEVHLYQSLPVPWLRAARIRDAPLAFIALLVARLFEGRTVLASPSASPGALKHVLPAVRALSAAGIA
jgi:hypothetical protein